MTTKLFDSDFDAWYASAAEGADFAGRHFDDAVAGSVNGEVTAYHSADAWALAHANLANNDLSVFDGLATKQFDTEALTLAIAGVFAGTTSFDV
jgi:hypothetical protein